MRLSIVRVRGLGWTSGLDFQDFQEGYAGPVLTKACSLRPNLRTADLDIQSCTLEKDADFARSCPDYPPPSTVKIQGSFIQGLFF